ncbi:MAG: VOC family protein [Alphaproteobacteria bacterium]|nr:VOC family protein [Alphaproteobacteria bacterium]MBV9692073.1 VOC family protein [Alphaproteobacteria bacterium]
MLRTDHIVFPVWNAKASLAFYRNVLGLKLVNAISGPDWGGYPWLMIVLATADGREIVLVSLKGAKRPRKGKLARDVRHLAFSETSVAKLEGWRRKLAAAKVAFWEEKHGAQHSVYFEDPNGVVLEITAPPTRVPRRENAAALAAASRWIAAS